MKLSLEKIRYIFQQYLGSNSYIAIVIKDIASDPSIPTIAITYEQKLIYNQNFIDEHIKSPTDLFTVLLHEILHPLYGHLFSSNDQTSNIAKDAIINASIFRLFYNETNKCDFMKRFYKPTGVMGLLRPDSNLYNTQFNKVYNNYLYGQNKISSAELLMLLKMLIPPDMKIKLIGSHGSPNEDYGLPQDVIEKIASEIDVKFGGTGCSTSSALMDLIKEIIATHITIKDDILRKFAVKRKFDNFIELNTSHVILRTPFPQNISRRDMLLIMNDYPVIFYTNRNIIDSEIQSGKVNIYLDVSGSVDQYLPSIIGILKNIENRIRDIYLFSTFIAKVSMKDLCKGKISTSGGTSFDCIAESIINEKIEKALIITDGCAYLAGSLRLTLRSLNPALMVILFGNENLYDNTFQDLAEIVRLKDVTK